MPWHVGWMWGWISRCQSYLPSSMLLLLIHNQITSLPSPTTTHRRPPAPRPGAGCRVACRARPPPPASRQARGRQSHPVVHHKQTRKMNQQSPIMTVGHRTTPSIVLPPIHTPYLLQVPRCLVGQREVPHGLVEAPALASLRLHHKDLAVFCVIV